MIRENKHAVIHHTDSLPCVHAHRRSRLGAFSNSARIASFLTGISSLNVEIVHISGKKIDLVDNISRNPTTCQQERCQICRYVKEQVNIGDNASKIMNVDAADIMEGRIQLPFTQRKTWIQAQKNDQTHQELLKLINTSQAPIKKKTGNENTKLKLLHNLYKEGKLKIMKDGLIMVKHKNDDGSYSQEISVPTVMFPGLIHALHIKLSHPSKLQLTKMIAKNFYTPGYCRIIEEVHNSCELCSAMKTLPKEIFSQSTGEMNTLGSNMSADIIERNQQQILIVREKLSQFTMTALIKDQTAETLKEACE